MDALIAAIITAAGSSTRMGGTKKEYLPITSPKESANGTEGAASNTGGPVLTVLGAAVSVFAGSPRIGLIVITVPPNADDGEYAARQALPEHLLGRERPVIVFVPGGSSRRISVHHALSTLAGFAPDYVLIHDGARPWVTPALVDRVIDAVIVYDAVIPALSMQETPKETADGFVRRHLKRASIAAAQTPQAFAFKPLLAAHEKAADAELGGREYTDDAEIWGEFVGAVAVVEGERANRKITFPEDVL
ncbi:MAG: 2-C-methyl-D-erythritol 4-phosphate cytidylyltransferase [Spirochaetaceae bacterium]|jgi:2-C-methyl-D-erythritol 4-phosphate cytidylyltransferase|nr:2-C-methyl-D-erythritol 4-phosphate cytidylyltransferase [Spirochaetaceae bacterium]